MKNLSLSVADFLNQRQETFIAPIVNILIFWRKHPSVNQHSTSPNQRQETFFTSIVNVFILWRKNSSVNQQSTSLTRDRKLSLHQLLPTALSRQAETYSSEHSISNGSHIIMCVTVPLWPTLMVAFDAGTYKTFMQHSTFYQVGSHWETFDQWDIQQCMGPVVPFSISAWDIFGLIIAGIRIHTGRDKGKPH